MTPPQAPLTGHAADRDKPEAVFSRLTTLTQRADFLKAARGPRVATQGFILQMRRRPPDGPDDIRVGFTCSKKVGNAVARNRAKRRLREIARLTLRQHGKTGVDYVLIGRAKVTATRPFDLLLADLRDALLRLHGPQK